MVAQAQVRTSFASRVLRAARLDGAVYEEIEADRTAMLPAIAVVVLGAVCDGLAAGVAFGGLGLVVATLTALFSWSLYAWLTYWLGTGPLKGPATQADWGQIARTLGFASAPKLVLLLGVLFAERLLRTLVLFWILATTVVALRAALDVTTARAAAVALCGWVLQIALTAMVIWLQSH